MAEKRCTRCKIVRPLSGFPRSNSKRDGRGSWCNWCQAEYRRENLDKIKAQQREYRNSEHGREMRARTGRTGADRAEYQRQYRAANAERLSVYNREYREQNAERIAELNRARALWKRYRLTVEQYDAMSLAQDGLCAICGQPEITEGRRLAVDHDRGCCPGRESCGECVRELLCTTCNNRLSALEKADWMESAVTYLSRNKKPGQPGYTGKK